MNYTIEKRQIVFLKKEDGSLIEINGETEFQDAWENPDGSITVEIVHCYEYSILKKDGTLFEINGRTVFYYLWYNDDGSIRVGFARNAYSILEPDGSWFTFNDETVFNDAWRYDNGSTKIEFKEEYIVDKELNIIKN